MARHLIRMTLTRIRSRSRILIRTDRTSLRS